MKLSTRARYGLSCMIAVSRLSDHDQPVSLERVSRDTNVSKRYLEQLAIALKHHGLLRAVSGRRGGYLLAQPAEKIRLGDIIEATIGPINVVECVLEPKRCEKSESCENRLIWMLINQRVSEVLAQYSLADLSSNERIQCICSELHTSAFQNGEGAEASVMPDCSRYARS
jgi:Rrf2 family protein